MAQRRKPGKPARPRRQRRRLSLSVRLSFLLLCAALLPLAAVVGFNDYQARNALIQQGTKSLTNDADAKVALVDAYVRERLLDGQALATLPTAQIYLAANDQGLAQALPAAMQTYAPLLIGFISGANDQLSAQLSSQRALAVGIQRDLNYSAWTMYDAAGDELLSTSPHQAGLSQQDLKTLQQATAQYITPVTYDAAKGDASLDIYTPLTLSMSDLAGMIQLQVQQDPNSLPVQLSPAHLAQLLQALKQLPGPVVGYMRATLRLDYIWGVVGGEHEANGSGSYAFITDQNGVRIADALAGERFTAVHALDATTQAQYGGSPIATVDLPDVYSAVQGSSARAAFLSPAVAAGKTSYQYVAEHLAQIQFPAALHVAPVPLGWTYFVLSPLPTVTRVADDQIRLSLISAAAISVLAVLLGLLVGTSTARPVQRSVAELEGATEALNALAAKQENSAGEQLWVVDACRTGLETVRYLADAMNQAARRIVEAGGWFEQYWDRLTEEQAQRTVQHLGELAQYIEEAARRQWASSERLDKAITVTNQVSDQLASGASAATQNAAQIEDVVSQLQHVVGGRAHRPAAADARAEARRPPEPSPSSGRMPGHETALPYPGRPALPGPGARPTSGASGRAPLSPGAWGEEVAPGATGYGGANGYDRSGEPDWGQGRGARGR